MTNRNILNEADNLLIKHGISELPLTIRKAEIIAQLSGWLLLTYDEGGVIIEACGAEAAAAKYPAFTLIHNNQYVILYKANISYEYKLFYILHEFGHIVLKHTSEQSILGATPSPEETARQECEANDFAMEMLAPSCVMFALGIKSAHQLERFGLTAEQALRHSQNIREPETEVEKALCERLPSVTYHGHSAKYARIAAVSGVIAAVAAAGVLLSCLVGIGDNKAQSVPDTTSFAENISEDEPSQSIVVYITKTGERYHKEDCRHIAGHDVIEVTIEEAENNGYTPCKDCF